MVREAWACVAYGRELGTACFFSAISRVCPSDQVCADSVDAEKKRVWRAIQEGAAAGDPVMVHMAQEITGPDDIFGDTRS